MSFIGLTRFGENPGLPLDRPGVIPYNMIVNIKKPGGRKMNQSTEIITTVPRDRRPDIYGWTKYMGAELNLAELGKELVREGGSALPGDWSEKPGADAVLEPGYYAWACGASRKHVSLAIYLLTEEGEWKKIAGEMVSRAYTKRGWQRIGKILVDKENKE